MRVDLDAIFSGDEAYGRYLDLHELHNTFVNAKFGRQLDYLTYLQQLSYFSEVPPTQRCAPQYLQYLERLVAYLSGFFQRTQPLADLGKQMDKVRCVCVLLYNQLVISVASVCLGHTSVKHRSTCLSTRSCSAGAGL